LAERADLVLLVLDRSRPLGPEDRQLLAAADAERTIVALNKSDLPGTVQPEDIRSLGFQHVLPVSALTGAGLDELRDAIEAAFVKGDIGADTVWITNERHFHALQRAAGVLKDLVARWNDTPLDLLALDLREAWQALGEITGAVWTEELLDCIFSNFCLGK
jgi:tRNA modification GTPase